MSENTAEGDWGWLWMLVIMFVVSMFIEHWFFHWDHNTRVAACAHVGGWLDQNGDCKPFAKAPEAK